MNQFQKSGKRLSEVFGRVLEEIKPGRRLIEIEKKANQLLLETGGRPSFKMVKNYHWATCLNLNEGVVHGIPDEKVIKSGDVVSLDMGLYYHGWHSDMAYTIQVGRSDRKTERFLAAGREALSAAVAEVKAGKRVGHISGAIQKVIEGSGYHCVRELTGHGVGRKLHQFPWIPCLLTSPVAETPLLKEGMGLAIEVIYALGKPDLKKSSDGWTIKTQDGKISALFEKTVLVTRRGSKVITPIIRGN